MTAQVLKFQVFNRQSNQVINTHIFHMSKANIGFCLMKMELDGSLRDEYYDKLDDLLPHLDLDTDSFKLLLGKKLEDLVSDCKKHTKKESPLGTVVDALIIHFKLGVQQ